MVFEHKSYVDPNLPIQLKYYEAVLWEESLKDNKKNINLSLTLFYITEKNTGTFQQNCQKI
jgi:hypothetical protein